MMHIGLDFDNTIVCYDRLFHRVARQRNLVPDDLLPGKNQVRDYLRQQDREEEWTQMQGYVYGVAIDQAPPFAGVHAFFEQCQQQDVPLHIVSHKTRTPVLGPPYDLHEAARRWLRSQDLYCTNDHNVHQHVYFEETKEDKLARIGQLGCTHFVDDLPEFLAESAFPPDVERILFDPNDRHQAVSDFARVRSWQELAHLLLRPGS